MASSNSDPYQTWAVAQWGSAIASDPAKQALVWGMSANPDGDVFSNLQEYAFGTDPRQFTQSPVITDVGQTAPGYMTVTSPQRTDDSALTILPQYSTDLHSWWPVLPLDSFSNTGSDFSFRKLNENPISSGMRAVSQVCTTPLNQNPVLLTRLVVMRHGAMAIGSPFDSVRFFDSISGSSNGTVESNSVILNGFSGSVSVSVSGGAHLIVNGVDAGASAAIAAGSSVRLRAASPSGTISAPASATHTLAVGNFSTAWNVTTRPFAMLPGISGTPSGYTQVSANVAESGAANIGIPITVPPPTGGMAPQLAISYSSQGGNGFLERVINFYCRIASSISPANASQ